MIGKLPSDIWYEIIFLLRNEKNFPVVMKVCHLWKQIAENDQLWKLTYPGIEHLALANYRRYINEQQLKCIDSIEQIPLFVKTFLRSALHTKAIFNCIFPFNLQTLLRIECGSLVTDKLDLSKGTIQKNYMLIKPYLPDGRPDRAVDTQIKSVYGQIVLIHTGFLPWENCIAPITNLIKKYTEKTPRGRFKITHTKELRSVEFS